MVSGSTIVQVTWDRTEPKDFTVREANGARTNIEIESTQINDHGRAIRGSVLFVLQRMLIEGKTFQGTVWVCGNGPIYMLYTIRR